MADKAVREAQELFDKYGNQEISRILTLPDEERDHAERKLNHEKTMMWVFVLQAFFLPIFAKIHKIQVQIQRLNR
jgi:hypothetical protein